MRFFAAAAIVVALSAMASAQSLAGVAKRTEEERAKAAAEKKEPARVITNSDLKPHPLDAVANAAAAALAAEKAKTEEESKRSATQAAPAEKPDPKQTEAYWKRRATELHARLAEDEKRAKDAREKLERFRHNTESVGCLLCPARNQLESQLIQMDEEQAGLDAQVASDRAAIQAFEDDGRRLGILPGWLRPR